jgi:hypothetical protein
VATDGSEVAASPPELPRTTTAKRKLAMPRTRMKLRGIGNNGFSFEGPALPFLTVRTVGDGFCTVNRPIVDSTPIGRKLDADGPRN